MGIPAREIRRAGADAGCEHGSDGAGTATSDALCEALAAEKRRSRAGGRVFHSAEACSGRRAGATIFLLHDAAAGNLVHCGIVRRRSVRAGTAGYAVGSDESGDVRVYEMALLSASEF